MKEELNSDIIGSFESMKDLIKRYGDEKFEEGKEEGIIIGHDDFIDSPEYIEQQLSFCLSRMQEMRERNLNLSEMEKELESEWLTYQPTLGLSNKNQTKIF